MARTKKRCKRAPVNKVTTSFRVSDELWAVLQRLIPKHRNPHQFGGGKPRTSSHFVSTLHLCRPGTESAHYVPERLEGFSIVSLGHLHLRPLV
jgi:hypothetical protein